MDWGKLEEADRLKDSNSVGCSGPLGCKDRKYDSNDKKCSIDCMEAYDRAINQSVNPNNCSYDPKVMKGQAIGMFHCPECGEMVLAGVSHP